LPHHARAAGEANVEKEVPSSLYTLPFVCHLDILDDDILFTLAGFLPSEHLISLAKAYTRFRFIVDSSHKLLKWELTCFFLCIPLQFCTLGIDITFEFKTRTFSSDFDWLSEQAF
jgi:hypothetical protein